ncbi:PilW family protein [Paenibacillus gorillae]|uniref:PilW family protein n=1 Tax=Paenibacillus gorillae TaxID=1243662 RepID=UPI0004B07172|nr:hypothetical protein [Paenibacillus gorillae]
MVRMVRNEKGLTLVEVTATLVLTVVILSGLIFLLNQTNQGVSQIQKRESVMKESRSIMNNLAASARRGGFIATKPDERTLQFSGSGGQYVYYRFEPSAKALSVTYRLKNDNGVLAANPTSVTLSEHVQDFTMKLAGPSVEVELAMSLPNNQIHRTSSIVNLVKSG